MKSTERTGSEHTEQLALLLVGRYRSRGRGNRGQPAGKQSRERVPPPQGSCLPSGGGGVKNASLGGWMKASDIVLIPSP